MKRISFLLSLLLLIFVAVNKGYAAENSTTMRLGVGASYVPPMGAITYTVKNGKDVKVSMGGLANASLATVKFSINDMFFIEGDAGFWFGEEKNQGLVLNPRGGMILAGKRGSIYGIVGLGLVAVNDDSDLFDVIFIEVGPGVELLFGDEIGLFGEFSGTLYFEPEVAFYAINGFRLGMRDYFSF